MALLTRYIDHANGNDGNDGTSEVQAWKTLYKVTGVIKTDAGTNNYHVYIQSGEAYDDSDDADHDGAGGAGGSVLFIDQLGGAAAPNIFEGYTTTPGDDGIVELDADTNTLTNGIAGLSGSAYTVFKNMEIWGASSEGIGLPAADYIVCKNVSAHDNDSNGIRLDDGCTCINCISYDNGAIGFDADNYTIYIACVSHGNTFPFVLNGGSVAMCLAFDCTETSIYNQSSGVGQNRGLVLNCTMDGEGAENGVQFIAGAAPIGTPILNCIFYDQTTPIAITTASAPLEAMVSGHCLYELNDNDNSNWPVIDDQNKGGIGDGGDVDDPANTFTTEPPTLPLHFYPHATSGALSSAMDAYFCINFWNDYNEGAGDNPPAE